MTDSSTVRTTVDLVWGPVSYCEWRPPRTPSSTVVLLHGAGVDSATLSWGRLGPDLAAAGYRVIAPDHPGFGQSPPAPWPCTQANLVAYVGEFVDALELDAYVLGGLSLGGGLTIGHVLARPERVRAALLFGTYGIMGRLSDGPLSALQQAVTAAMVKTGALSGLSRWMAGNAAMLSWSMSTLIRDPAQRTPELMAEVQAAAKAGHGFEQFAQWQRDQVGWRTQRTDYTNRLSSFRPPALIVHGTEDGGVPVAHARTAARLIPQARLVLVDGAGHWVQRDRPAEVSAAVTEFLNRVVA
ncbi:alpha/beta fold hydrolase [[Mycobacterium] burgundiense]|uniref:Alpha/beta hydrolase n=1 Tax=[Mycobacterium] burgundiense TaxID=3064286 RepID=A0ABN9NHM7_9MYCO|nr:alpha/beta hydrolase [Mycolicibacterium sp. MU0053]CAJ1506467.1 alpha/beta hydrolase [Mycolicibacterium sp. MU0053]